MGEFNYEKNTYFNNDDNGNRIGDVCSGGLDVAR